MEASIFIWYSIWGSIRIDIAADFGISGGAEGGLFHEEITFKSGVTMSFAELS